MVKIINGGVIHVKNLFFKIFFYVYRNNFESIKTNNIYQKKKTNNNKNILTL